MALRDVAGVLSGLRRVAVALWSEGGSELRHTVTNSPLHPLTSSLCEAAEKATASCGGVGWEGGRGRGCETRGLGDDDFPEWASFEKGFPSVENFPGGFKHNVGAASPPETNAAALSGSTKAGMASPVVRAKRPSFSPSPPPLGHHLAGQTSRRHHTLATPRFACHHTVPRMWVHSGTRYGSDTVVRGSASGRVEAAQRKTTKSKQKLNPRARERAVPASRVGRMVSFGGLAAGLGMGTAVEVAKRTLGMSDSSSSQVPGYPLLSEANIERIVNTLCRVRGAALKIGQMISLQDSNLIPEPIQDMFDRVRNSADFMPLWQMERMMQEELGEGWREKLADFDPKPLAAASIGQVHSAVLHSGQPVAIKIQYPGVAESINSDIDNLMGILKLWNILPEGLFMDAMVAVARKELAWETDYTREAKCQNMFRGFLADDPGFLVPEVFSELSTKRVLTTELIQGMPLDQCASLPQETRNDIAARVLDLVMRELFEFQFMQTDPNWSNFFYNTEEDRICLLDFGASREYPKMFTDHYLKVIHGSITEDREKVLENSKVMGFLTGYESKTLLEAHYRTSLILGEPFKHDRIFDFTSQDATSRIQQLVPVLLDNRLAPPPEESYSILRKYSGAFLLCAKLGAMFNCYEVFQRIYNQYKFSM